MEMNESESPSAKNSDPTPTTASDEQVSSLRARKYNCNFCKGSFSNAQALGGHMNIHRKDKAKLKQSSLITESPQQCSQITNTTRSPAYNLFPLTISTNSESRAAVADQWTWNYDSENNDTTSTTLEVDDQDQKHSQKNLSSSFSHGTELDLELRLGHESASDASSRAKGTRKFL